MTLADVTSALASVPLFSGFSQKQIRLVAESGREYKYKGGTTIVEGGSVGVGFYMVLNGRVEVRKGPRVLARLSNGQFFGEMSLIDGEPRSADVLAVQPTECFTLSTPVFYALIRQHPELALLVLKELVKRLRVAQSSDRDATH
jgi:CRP-like cAMP-binding protein